MDWGWIGRVLLLRRRGAGSRVTARPAVLPLLVVAALAAAVCGCGGSPGATGDASAAFAGSSAAPVEASSSPAVTKTPVPGRTPASGSGGSSAGAGGSGPATRFVFVDVGQGDAAIIRNGSWTGLVDGGPAASAGAVSAELERLGVRRLDTVVVTHLHADHTGGLPALIDRYRPRRALLAATPVGGLVAALRGAGTEVVQARRGMTFRCGSARARVLSPAALSGDPNADSIVLLVSAGGRSILFTGDCTGPNEEAVGEICARGPPVYALKVSHHGSRYSTTTGFLAGARPRFAVISVGRNSYGHPSADAVGRLRRDGVRIYSTRQNGTVTLTIAAGGAATWRFTRSSSALTRGVGAGGSGGGAAASSTSSTTVNPTVYVTATGECYHRGNCRYLSSSRIAIKLVLAKDRGYRPCSVCDPPR